jgi:hypothetical protein
MTKKIATLDIISKTPTFSNRIEINYKIVVFKIAISIAFKDICETFTNIECFKAATVLPLKGIPPVTLNKTNYYVQSIIKSK